MPGTKISTDILTIDYRSPEAAAQFVYSLKNTGFAIIRNHPIPWNTIEETYRVWEAFFGLDSKNDYTFDPKLQSGYFPFRSENAKNYSIKDLKEFFHVYPFTKLPTEPESLAAKTNRHYESMTKLASQLLSWIDKESPAEVKAKFSMPLSEMLKDSQETLLRVIHYPPMTGTEEEGAVRAAAHEDINLITLLPAATSPGLQVQDQSGQWIDVKIDPQTIVINAGDMLQVASGGFYRSTTHRVVNPYGDEAKKPRFSMPLFLHPRADVRLSDQYTALSYLHERLRELGLKKD